MHSIASLPLSLRMQLQIWGHLLSNSKLHDPKFPALWNESHPTNSPDTGSLVFLQNMAIWYLGQAWLSFRGQFTTLGDALGDVLTGSHGVWGILKLPFPSPTLFPTPASPSHYQ